MLTIDFHPAMQAQSWQTEAIAALQANRIAPKFLYVTPRQAELWRQVFLRHSPIHDNPEFVRIYRDAFEGVASEVRSRKVALVGLGCGTGLKELELYGHLKANGHEVLFSAVDVSHDLVMESAQKLVAAGAEYRRNLVCDLAEAAHLAEWLGRETVNLPRIITFFGLVPNLPPLVVMRLFRAILRPGDVILVSAHLAPIREGIDVAEAMRSVLPQYANEETRAWLSAGLEQWALENLVGPIKIEIGEIEGIPAFVARARWKSGEPLERWGHRFTPKREEALEVFHSLRYTPMLFEHMIQREGFDVELLAMTACREEGIWAVRTHPTD